MSQKPGKYIKLEWIQDEKQWWNLVYDTTGIPVTKFRRSSRRGWCHCEWGVTVCDIPWAIGDNTAIEAWPWWPFSWERTSFESDGFDGSSGSAFGKRHDPASCHMDFGALMYHPLSGHGVFLDLFGLYSASIYQYSALSQQKALIFLVAGDRSGRTLIPSWGKRTQGCRCHPCSIIIMIEHGWHLQPCLE